MTLFYPDISQYQGGMQIQSGTVAVCAKCTEGHTVSDSAYENFKNQTLNEGGLFFGYHFMWDDSDAEASWWANHCDGEPQMLDVENENTTITVGGIRNLIQKFRNLGGICNLVYLPHWYWQQMGSPDLSSLPDNGIQLVSSNYTSYSDSGIGWSSYGGISPVIWQYTDAQSYGGTTVDFNAFRGTFTELESLVRGDEMANSDDILECVLYLLTNANTGPFKLSNGNTVAGNGVNLTLAALKSQVNGLPGAISTIESQITSLQNEISSLKADVDTLKNGGLDPQDVANRVVQAIGKDLTGS